MIRWGKSHSWESANGVLYCRVDFVGLFNDIHWPNILHYMRVLDAHKRGAL